MKEISSFGHVFNSVLHENNKIRFKQKRCSRCEPVTREPVTRLARRDCSITGRLLSFAPASSSSWRALHHGMQKLLFPFSQHAETSECLQYINTLIQHYWKILKAGKNAKEGGEPSAPINQVIKASLFPSICKEMVCCKFRCFAWSPNYAANTFAWPKHGFNVLHTVHRYKT